ITGGATGLNKVGTGKLVLTGDNQLTGFLTANEGVLNFQHSHAAGAPSGGGFVRDRAPPGKPENTLGPARGGQEALPVEGAGSNFTGALRSVAGNSNSWAGAVSIASINAIDAVALFPNGQFTTFTGGFVGVDAGKLTLSGVVSASDPIKMGAGTL